MRGAPPSGNLEPEGIMEINLAGLSEHLASAVRKAGDSVVAVHARDRFSASGLLWRPGVVVTAEHAIKKENDIRVTLPDGQSASAELAGRDPGTDLAVLRVPGADGPAYAAAADGVEPGLLVLAVGRSAAAGATASLGIVSAVSGAWRTWRGGRLDRYVRLDLALYPGLSGAAVIDVAGALVGIATSALSRVAPVAIPSSTVNRIAEELLAAGRVSRPYLGVGLQPVELPEHLTRRAGLDRNTGLIVLTVEPGGPAERAGLLVGDIVVTLDGAAVDDTDAVQGVLEGRRTGEPVGAVLLRGGIRQELAVVLGERPGRVN
jgi:S1-C subfamily serine protease